MSPSARAGVDLVAPRPHQQSLARAPGGGHRGEVRGRPDLLVVVPAGDVQHRDVDLADPVLVADRLPVGVERLVATVLAPALGSEAGGLVEVAQRSVPVHGHPVHGVGVLERPPVGHPVPVDVHRPGNARRILDERVRWGHHHDHRRQRRRVMQRRQPLDPARVAASEGGHLPVAPVLGGGPGDHVDAVEAVVAIRVELPLGVPAAAHVDPHGAVPGAGKSVGAGRRALARAPIRGAHHNGRRGAVGGEHEIGGQRDPVAHRDPQVEAARERLIGEGRHGCQRYSGAAGDGLSIQVAQLGPQHRPGGRRAAQHHRQPLLLVAEADAVVDDRERPAAGELRAQRRGGHRRRPRAPACRWPAAGPTR